MEIYLNDLRTDYVRVCETIRNHGEKVRVRGSLTHELTGMTLVVQDPRVPLLPIGVGRGVNAKLAAIEALSLIAGVWRHDLVTRAAPGYSDVLVSGTDAAAAAEVAYGPRTADQVSYVLDLLRQDPTSRQAVLSIWRASDLRRDGDKPCTLTMQFLLRNDELECHVTMRSQDVWLGLAMDLFMFTQLQHTLANMLGIRAGRFVHHVGSLHAYERDFERIDALHAYRPTSIALRDLPLGVWGQAPVITARLLLDHDDTPMADTSNPWYEHQMAKIHGTVQA